MAWAEAGKVQVLEEGKCGGSPWDQAGYRVCRGSGWPKEAGRVGLENRRGRHRGDACLSVVRLRSAGAGWVHGRQAVVPGGLAAMSHSAQMHCMCIYLGGGLTWKLLRAT